MDLKLSPRTTTAMFWTITIGLFIALAAAIIVPLIY